MFKECEQCLISSSYNLQEVLNIARFSMKLNLYKQTKLMQHKSRNESPEIQGPSFVESEESHDVLVSKHLIPPPLMLLPKQQDCEAKSLMPMIPLPNFVGIIPNFQPLEEPREVQAQGDKTYFNWIGDAFDNVVYRKYQEASYCKVDDSDENWNIWACDVGKLINPSKKDEPRVDSSKVEQFYVPKNDKDKTLVFESRFQCGNLSLVSKITDNQYNLLLQNDINTNGYSQWFFFKVTNTFKGHKCRFNILNLYKHSNLYKGGMKIIIYSIKESNDKNLSWHRGGEDIQYFQNGYSKSTTEYKPFFTLSWEYTFPHSEDEVYFAYSYPFTYSNLNKMIEKIEADPYLRNLCIRTPLCKTIAGNRVDILTITEDHPSQELDKSYVIITARIHPGESVSSFVCNGILQFLLSNSNKAKKLRQNFIFKIIPMMNPDGVIHGNYRSNISGFDLNRKWENPSKHYHPEVYYCKKLIQNLKELGDIVLFCDLHGHSMKKNAFIYGSHNKLDPRKGKEFPLLISKLFKGFSFKDCSFLDIEERQGTTRTVLAKQVVNQNVFTLESSFCGPEHEDIHFTIRHFEDLGEKFCEAILFTFRERIKQININAAMKNKSHFNVPPDQSCDSQLEYESLIDLQEIDDMNIRQRVNSENSQGSEPQNENLTMLQQRTIKKYLILKNTRPLTSLMGRRQFMRKSMSKDMTVKFKDRKIDFNIHKSNSPTKRKELYEPPKVEKIVKPLQNPHEKIKIEPKLFEPIEFMSVGLERKKNYRSTTKISTYQTQRPMKKEEKGSKSNVKITINKNYDAKVEEAETFFKNSCLRNFIKQEPKRERRASDFIIRKSNKITIADDKNATNLFKSVLSSLRKERK